MCSECQRREETERRMWLAVRRGLLAIVKAIEIRYPEPAAVDRKRSSRLT